MKSALIFVTCCLALTYGIPGGFSDVGANDERTVQVAKFAVDEMNKNFDESLHFVLQGIVKAESQVVNGQVYRMTLKMAVPRPGGQKTECNVKVYVSFENEMKLVSNMCTY